MIREVRTDPFIFRWPVSIAGYEWLESKMDGGLRLIARDEPGAGIRLEEPPNKLFRDFAALIPTEDEIRDFANAHGDLFRTYDGIQDIVVRKNQTATYGTSLESWKKAIQDMRQLVELWDHIQYRRITRLRRLIDMDKNGISYSIGGRWVLLAHKEILLTAPMSRFSPRDVILPARYALQKEVNRRLADPSTLTVPELAWTPDNFHRLIFRPSNLLAALWLQFAQELTGEFKLKACEVCGKPIQVGPGGRRADTKTCSAACRQKKKRKQ